MGTDELIDEIFDHYEDDQSFCSVDEHNEDDQYLLWERAQEIAQDNHESEIARIEWDEFCDD